MAKNEAKVKFTAETGQFNDQIKKSNDEMAKLRAEMKLNAEQMKTTGTTVEGLEQKQKLLTQQLEASKSKTEALSQKVEKAKQIYGENSAEVKKLETQLINAQSAEEKLNRQISDCTKELEAQRDAANATETATEKLTKKISKQEDELSDLKDEYVETVLKFGDTSDEAKDLAKKIEDLSGELKDNKKKMSDAKKAADELDGSIEDVGDAADNSGDGFTIFKGVLADLASAGIQAAIGAVKDLASAMWDLPDATLEIRQDFATLNTAFTNVNLSTTQATDTWKKLYRVFGEDDRAVEAANNIARMAENQEDLDAWVRITTGVWGTYQDSLPVEALAESAGETAKVGTVTGNLADALNWSSAAAAMFADYMSDDVVTAEDAFNVALSECSDEQERQALITETLTTLYGGAADSYEKASGSMLDAKEAAAEEIIAQNNLATALEDATTEWKKMKTEMTVGLLPVAKKISDWAVGAMGWMKEHPKLIGFIASTLGIVAGVLSTVAIGWKVYQGAQWLANTAILGCPLTWLVGAVVAVGAAIAALIIWWDEITAAVTIAAQAIWNAIKTAWDWIVNLFSTVGMWIYNNVIAPVANFFTGLFTGIYNGVVTAWNAIMMFFSTIGTWIYDNVIAPIANFFVGLWESIVSAWHTVIDPWVEIVKTLATMFYDNVIVPVADFFVGLWEGISTGFTTAWDAICEVASTIGTWFYENVIVPVADFFVGLWDGISSGFSTAWDAICGVASTIGTWFYDNVIAPVGNFFTGMWDGLKNGAVAAWEGVKSVFSKVAEFFGDVFSTAWSKVKSVFSATGEVFLNIGTGILEAFKVVLNAIIKGLNVVIAAPFKGFNKILDTIHGISIVGIEPFAWLTWRAPVPQIPYLAEGGILTQPTLNVAGEAGPEAVIPLDRLYGFISNAVDRSLQSSNMDKLIAAIENLADRNIDLNINGQKFATATASDTDTVHGNRMALSRRGLAL